MKTVVSEKGQITIPKAVRDKLGIVAGTVVEFESATVVWVDIEPGVEQGALSAAANADE